jgi:hypothetical protein
MVELKLLVNQNIDRRDGDILREAERALWTDRWLRATVRAALRLSNPALVAKLTSRAL